MNVSSKVPASFAGASVIEYLATRFTYLPEADWRQFARQGKISRNGAPCDETDALERGDIVGCALPDFAAPQANFDYTVVYEDPWLLGINKPAGLRVHGSGRFVGANLVYHLRNLHEPAYPEVDLVNRLDADTSGLVLLARSKSELSQLAGQFAQGLVHKRYLAVVAGRPQPDRGVIDLPIGPVKGALVPRFAVDVKEGKPALTRYATVKSLGEQFTLVELRPASGRTHQLRVHLAAIGHPIAGDALYTMNDEDYLAWRRNPPGESPLRRQALHSSSLEFIHPVHRTSCTLSAPLAPDIERFISGLSEMAMDSPRRGSPAAAPAGVIDSCRG